MKQLQLELNKRLLIVEYDNDKSFQHDLSFYRQFKIGGFEQYIVEFICQGSDLTEDIAKGLVNKEIIEGVETYMQYDCTCNNYFDEDIVAFESFISAIESKNYHWGENPYEKELDSCNAYTDMFTIAKRARKYEEAESRTFNPEKTIIFEIL